METTIDVSKNEWRYVAEMKTDLDPDLPRVSVLQAESNQVMLRLIVNAVQSIGEVVGEGGQRREIGIEILHDGECVEIKSGMDMFEEAKKRIFATFITTKVVGKESCQVLAIAWFVIVHKHAGSIQVESAEEGGSTFFGACLCMEM